MNASFAVALEGGMQTLAAVVLRSPHFAGTAWAYVWHVVTPACDSQSENCWNVAEVPWACQHALHEA